MNDSVLIAKILNDLPDGLRPDPQSKIYPGKLQIVTEDISTPDAAFAAFRRFDGPGWLQDARHPDLLMFEDGNCPQLESPWPEYGERVSKDRDAGSSIQLVRISNGWRLTTFTQQPGNEMQILMQESRLRYDLKAHVQYEVAWEPVRIGTPPHDHVEQRAVTSRFLGFVARNSPPRTPS